MGLWMSAPGLGVQRMVLEPTRLIVWGPELGETVHRILWPDGATGLALQMSGWLGSLVRHWCEKELGLPRPEPLLL